MKKIILLLILYVLLHQAFAQIITPTSIGMGV